MLDYTTDKDEKKRFILYYEENGDTLNVHLADGEEYPVPNTKENEEKLLDQMEEQVEDVWSFKNKRQKAKKAALGGTIYDAFFLVLNVVFVISNPNLVTSICIGLFALCGAINIASYKNNKKVLEDVKKHELFLRNKTRINEYLNRGNENVNEDTINPVKEETKPILTINNIHQLDYKDVDKIVSDIDRDEYFGIDRPKVLTKSYIPSKKKNS